MWGAIWGHQGLTIVWWKISFRHGFSDVANWFYISIWHSSCLEKLWLKECWVLGSLAGEEARSRPSDLLLLSDALLVNHFPLLLDLGVFLENCLVVLIIKLLKVCLATASTTATLFEGVVDFLLQIYSVRIAQGLHRVICEELFLRCHFGNLSMSASAAAWRNRVATLFLQMLL